MDSDMEEGQVKNTDEAKLQVETRTRADAKAQNDARAKANAEARAKVQAKAKADNEAKARAIAEARAKTKAEAQAKSEARLKAKADNEAKARAIAEARAKVQAEALAKAEEKAKLKADREAKAQAVAEARAKVQAEAQAKSEARAKAKADNEAKARAIAEARAKVQAQALAKAEEKAKLKADREVKAQAVAEARAKVQAEALAKAEEKAKLKSDREAKAQAVAEARAKVQAKLEARNQAKADLKARNDAKAAANAEARAKLRAEAKANAEARAKARAEAKLAELDADLEGDLDADADSASASRRFFALLRKGDHEGFVKLENELLARSVEQWTPVVQAFRALKQLDDIAAEAKLEDKFRPRVWWMRTPYPGNFGDILTPYIMWKGFGVMPRWAPITQADGLCIGSIAKFARPGKHVWGTGMPRDSDPLCPTAIYASVRGPLSRAAVLASGGRVPEIYGDPAVLLPRVYHPTVKKTHRIGLIPHVLYESMFRRALAALGADHIKIISLLSVSLEDIERVVRDILSCDEIVSTSLHGVIVSHAYGIPCQSLRVQDADMPAVDSFKMQDYKLSVGLTDTPLTVQAGFTDLKWIEPRQCVLPKKKIDTQAVADAFPFPRSSSALAR